MQLKTAMKAVFFIAEPCTINSISAYTQASPFDGRALLQLQFFSGDIDKGLFFFLVLFYKNQKQT